MKLKKMLAAVTAAALAVSTMAVSSFSVSAATSYNTITINAQGGDSLGSVFIATSGDYLANDEAPENPNWIQFNKADGEVPTKYADAFTGTSFTFKADASISEIETTIYVWHNSITANVAHTFTIDTSKAVNSALELNVVPKGDITDTEPASWYKVQDSTVTYVTEEGDGETLYNWDLTVDPATVELAVDETQDLTYHIEITDTDSGDVVNEYPNSDPDDPDPEIVWISDDDDVATVDATGKVTAVGEGTTSIWAAYYNDDIFEPNEDTGDRAVYGECTVTVTAGGGEGEGTTIPANVEMQFDDTREVSLSVSTVDWGEGFSKAAQVNVEKYPTGITKGLAYGDLKGTTISVTGINIKNISIDGLTADDVEVAIYAFWGAASSTDWDETYVWSGSNGSTWDLSIIENVPDDKVLKELGYQLTIKGDKGGIDDMDNGAIVKVNSAATGNDDPPPAAPTEIPAIVVVYTQGNEAGGWDWASCEDVEVTITADTDPVELSWTIANASVDSEDKLGQTGVQVAVSGENSMSFVGTKLNIEITDITIGGEAKADIKGEYALVANWNNTGAERMVLLDSGFDDYGKEITCKVKVTLVSSAPVTPPPGSGDDNKDPVSENPADNTSAAAPSVRDYPVVIPIGYTSTTSAQVTDTLTSAAEGDKVSVSLVGSTSVDKAALEAIAGKDIAAEFKLAGGVSWEINGKDIEKAKKVDLGVRLRSKNIPDEKIAEVAGDNKTVQFSLRHNGDFGFRGVLVMPFNTKYNDQFANLYYYNKAKGSLDFVGSSKISDGKASFVFTHASDYVVVIDDHAYGEDVSSASGVYETASETSEAPYAAIVSVIAILGAAAIVIRKRLAK